MKNNRTQIDNFLLSLEVFVTKYHADAEDVYDVENTLIPVFKSNKDNTSFVAPNKRRLEIPNLALLCNLQKIGYVNRRDKDKLCGKFKMNRTSVFVQSVAYKLKYKLVKDVSYEHIFMKHIIYNSEKVDIIMAHRDTYLNKLLEHNLKEFLVPEDYDTNNNLILY